MSMLSAKRDRLLGMADRLDQSGLHDMASVVRDAGSTIWELRNKLNDLIDERDELLEQVARFKKNEWGEGFRAGRDAADKREG